MPLAIIGTIVKRTMIRIRRAILTRPRSLLRVHFISSPPSRQAGPGKPMTTTSSTSTIVNPSGEMAKSGRLLSLDVLRGLTIAFMILVNNQGNEAAAYWPLKHAAWNGFTPTDLVFPTFLFLVGITTVFSTASRLAQGATKQSDRKSTRLNSSHSSI